MDQERKICILISGRRGAGKDTAFEWLQTRGFKRFAFADKLKDFTSLTYVVDRSWMDDPKFKEVPLLQYPVIAEDVEAAKRQMEIYCHFRTEKGVQPVKKKTENGDIDDDERLKRVGNILCWEGEQLYWTPRALLVLEGMTKRAVNPNFWVDFAARTAEGPLLCITDYRLPNEFYRVKTMLEAKGYLVIAIRIDSNEKQTSFDSSETALDNWDGFYCRILNLKEGKNIFWDDLQLALFPLQIS
jgi:hypothetical protein